MSARQKGLQAEVKVCQVCGRTMQWRKAWAKNWADVKYCSDRCRRTRNDPNNEKLELAIMLLLKERADGTTICPSEAARLVGGDGWRDLMQPARDAARRLVERGAVVITQKGKVVDVSTARGPIRIRKIS